MPPPGDNAGKLGHRYEGIWTIDCLLQLAAGESQSLTVELIDHEGRGIEFVVRHLDGTREFHSAKRQRSEGEWSLAVLTRPSGTTGRSILKDLFDKLGASLDNRCCFVSSTGANDLRELAERARALDTADAFLKALTSKRLRDYFERYLLPLTSNDPTLAHDFLRRTRVTLIDQASLTAKVEQRIAYLVYRLDLPEVFGTEVRELLGGFISDHLGTEIRGEDVWRYLLGFRYAKRHWAADPTIHDCVRRGNQTCIRTVESELINGMHIGREESQSIVDGVTCANGSPIILVSAAAGAGKSCVLAQAVQALEARGVPLLVVRMDRHDAAHNTQDIGRHMELPRSPAVVLAGLANGGDCVLLIDQVDAISQVSGRYPHLWEVFDSLCVEADAYPKMRLVIACRDFDLEHDRRLRKLRRSNQVKQIAVPPLSPQAIDAAILEAGCDPASLTPQEKALLGTPLHLYLFLNNPDGEQQQVPFRNIGDLFDRYWDRKEKSIAAREGHASGWIKVIDRLCETMSRDFTVYAPRVILDEWTTTVDAMMSEHVLVLDGNQVRFFHESFFDYAFARRFLARGNTLLEFLRSSEQHLFRRSQVRQVLAFQRDQDYETYLAELRALLADSGVRFHIKRLVVGWLGSLSDPKPGEWKIVEAMLPDHDLRRHILPSIRNSLPWFDLLFTQGILSGWLASDDRELTERALWFLLLDRAQKERADAVAALLAPYVGRTAEWTSRVRSYFSHGNTFHSRAIQEVFLSLLDRGAYDDASLPQHDSWWHQLLQASQETPLFALKAITRWLDRKIAVVATNPASRIPNLHTSDPVAAKIISEVAKREPTEYVDKILPRVLTMIDLSAMPSEGALRSNRIWPVTTNIESNYIDLTLLEELMGSLENLATTNPDKLDVLTSNLVGTDYSTVACLLLRAWSANPERFGNRCIRFLADDIRRLDLEYTCCSGGGNGHAAISRQAIAACIAYAAPEERERLEGAIIGWCPPEEAAEQRGWHERLLFEAIGEKYLSECGRNRLQALRHKFPSQAISLPPRDTDHFQRAQSPIPPETAQHFTDENWLDAMRKYDYGWDGPGAGNRPVAGDVTNSAVELSRVLQPQARLGRVRFAALVEKMEDSIRTEYFQAILEGICGIENLTPEERKADREEFSRLPAETILGVIRRLHRLPNHPCGRSICWAFMRLAERGIPEEDLRVLSYYAIEDPDPDSESSERLQRLRVQGRDSAEDLYQDAYNSTRGAAAEAIAALLFADYARSQILLPTVRRMVSDSSTGVKACVVRAILPVLNHDRNEAVQLFLDVCGEASTVLVCEPCEAFLQYACTTHYSQLRDLLQRALQSGQDAIVAVAARQTCLAALTDQAAEADADAVRTGSEPMRCAAAQVYSHNIDDPAVGTVCQQYLPRLFVDNSAEVRAKAVECFGYLEDSDPQRYTTFIRAYIESPAFPSPNDGLLQWLDKSAYHVPDIVTRLAENFIAVRGAEANDIRTASFLDASVVSKLVMRLYTQSDDETVRRKCLNLIDGMERLAFYGIDSQLAEHDR